MSHCDLNTLRSKLKEFFGYDAFKPLQEEVITHLMDGGDAFVLMPTGGGKSLCYQLPALLMDGTAIVISPLIALMKNQVDAIRGFETEGGEAVAHFLNSSLSRPQLNQVQKDVLEGRTKLLYVAPESLNKAENVNLLKKIHISFYAVDEAHCISEWGHDFRPEYRRIREIIGQIQDAPVMALTATATPKVQSDILKNLGIPDAKVFKASFNRKNLYYEIRDKVDPKRDIIRFIKQNPGKSGIIYCLSRKKVEEISELLEINGISALPYHAGLDAKVRSENQDKFLSEEVDVIVATIAFGMGIDKPDVRFVIHYDIPKSLEGYYQETGRAGRDGLEGRCIAFYSHKDIEKLEKFLQGKPVSEQEIGRQLIGETVSYAESSVCRRKSLLAYFGESYESDNCGACDNCLSPKQIFDARGDICLIVELVESLPSHFKADHLAAILAGEENAMIKSYRHDTHPLFGVGTPHGKDYFASIIYQGLVNRFFEKEIETYGLIYVTDKGRAFRDNPYRVEFAMSRVFLGGGDDDDDEVIGGVRPAGGMTTEGGGGGDPVLLKMLKDLRKDLAKRRGLKTWVIFSDPSLEDMSVIYPITIEELSYCQGVGKGKAQKFGKEFIELIERYVEENEILRPEDIVIKTTHSKSADKIYIIQSIDRKIDLEMIASAKGLSMEELIQVLESIVYSGTKIDLNYYIEECIDEDEVEEVYTYFHDEAETDSIHAALEYFGDDFPENDLRLLRLQFICKYGN